VNRIRIIYSDFDGVINDPQPGVFMDLGVIKYIREHNDAVYGLRNGMPPVAINSGRPEAYIEAQMQVLGVQDYCVFENGAGIFRFIDKMIEIQMDKRIPLTYALDYTQIDEHVKKRFQLFKQPNKEYNLTYIFSMNDPKIAKVAKYVSDFIQDSQMNYYVEFGVNFINIYTNGVTKGTGLQMALKQNGYQSEEVAGIGDSDSDWEFLRFCGFTACPSNASEGLKKKVNYLSPYPHGQGTVDIIKHILELNKNQ
jgi:HAD superfamily hydrolase (TIGR01484 family)